MDGFAEKFKQKIATAQEIITANGQAEATETQKLQEEVRALIDTFDEKMGDLKVASDSTDTEKLENHIHKENVRVYRNVQASVNDELAKQTESIEADLNTQTETIMARIEELSSRIDNMETSVKNGIKKKAVLPLQIIILILVLGDLAFNVLVTFGIL